MSRQAVIIGVGDVPLEGGRVVGGGSPLQVQARAAKQAADDAGISMSDIDGLAVAGLWGVPGPGQLATVTMGEYLGIQPRYADGTNIGGAAFESHVAHAAMAIERGFCDTVLVTYASTQKSDRSRQLGGRPSVLTMQFENVWGVPQPVGGYAMAAMRHMHEFGTTSEQLAEIAVATRKWAQLNPGATMQEPMTIDDVLNSMPICDPLHLYDCCLVTDGGGAVIVTTEDNARAAGRQPVYVRGFGESHTHWHVGAMPDLARISAAEASGKAAFEMAGVSHDDIDVVEVYDSFTITVLLTLEALGFCARGEGGAFVSGQRTAPGGAFPLNTNGGGLSYAHPGMYGIFLLIEAVRQLRHECGDRQVADATTALVHGTGGTLSSGATVILSTE